MLDRGVARRCNQCVASTLAQEEQERAFTKALRELDARIKILTNLRLELLDRLSLQRELDAIGGVQATASTT